MATVSNDGNVCNMEMGNKRGLVFQQRRRSTSSLLRPEMVAGVA